MQDLEKEFYEELDIRQAFTKVEYLEFIVPVLPPQFVQFAHQGNAVHCQVEDVSSRPGRLRVRGSNRVHLLEKAGALRHERVAAQGLNAGTSCPRPGRCRPVVYHSVHFG